MRPLPGPQAVSVNLMAHVASLALPVRQLLAVLDLVD